MASYTLYPPLIESSRDAFISDRVVSFDFTLSKYNISSDFTSIQVTVVKADSNKNALVTDSIKSFNKSGYGNGEYNLTPEVNTGTTHNYGFNRYYETGMILDVKPFLIDSTNKRYRFYLYPEELGVGKGWESGSIYKIQIRLSKVDYNSDSSLTQIQWLNTNSDYFSEWSTACITKAIEEPEIRFLQLSTASNNENIFKQQYNENITLFNEVDSDNIIEINNLDTFSFNANYTCQTTDEYLYAYEVQVQEDGVHLEDDGVQYADQTKDTNKIAYTSSYEPVKNSVYTLFFTFTTINNYKLNFIVSFTATSTLYNSELYIDILNKKDDTCFRNILNQYSTVSLEEDEGRCCYQIYQKHRKDLQKNNYVYYDTISGIKTNSVNVIYEDDDKVYASADYKLNGVIYVRRTDLSSNFKRWKDIRKIDAGSLSDSADYLMYADYTLESGQLYKYGIQCEYVDSEGTIIGRTSLNIMSSEESYSAVPAMRDFSYCYLLGQGQQLKTLYNCNISNFKINVKESSQDTIGGIYPFVSRNGNTYYKTFSISGYISYEMDDQDTFDDMSEYKTNYVANGLDNDFIYEKLFRDKVITFLHDGKVKLFKSAAEGNIMVRLLTPSLSAEESLGRRIWSFSASAVEVCEADIDNYDKYNLLDMEWEYDENSITHQNTDHIEI